MKFYPTLTETLARRFDDMDEVRDISKYGANTGVSDFTYTYDIDQFYNQFEREIEVELIDELGFTYEELSKGINSFAELRSKCVWVVVEMFCHNKVDLIDNLTIAQEKYLSCATW